MSEPRPADWFKPIHADEHILLGKNTALHRIPVNVAPKQAFFLDGIRHAVEVMDLAFARLQGALTKLARETPRPEDLPLICTGVFLDAWAMVDALDRFRTLYTKMPGVKFSATADDNVVPLQTALKEFRDLRNVADHLAQRADFVLSKGGAAFGELSWLTLAAVEPSRIVAWRCTLRPGTLRTPPKQAIDPIMTTFDFPTSHVCLSAGGHVGNLSGARMHVAGRVRYLDAQIGEIFDRPENAHVGVMRDFFGRVPVEMKLPPAEKG